MTQEQQTSKNLFRLNGGLNTEFNELGFPEGYTTDEANYELLVDGSRRRRKGLAEEASGASRTVATHTTSEFHQSYIWRNVGSDPALDVVVYRKGSILHFAKADEIVSDNWYGSEVDLDAFSDTATPATVDNLTVTFSQGRGDLFVGGQYVRPFYVKFDSAAETFSAVEIAVRVRDYKTVDDGTSVAFEPTGTITDAHRYNLRNRGWSETEYTTFESDTGKFPSRNSAWYRGYIRKSDTTVGAGAINPDDGTVEWSSTKMDAEVFGNSSAPKGALFINPRDTTRGEAQAGSTPTSIQNISTWSTSGTGTWTITVTVASDPGLSVTDKVLISGQAATYTYYVAGGTEPMDGLYSFNGEQTVTAVAGAGPYTFSFTQSEPYGWSNTPIGGSWDSQYSLLGQIDTTSSLTRDNGVTTTKGYAAVEFHAGRVFYGGLQTQEWADTIFYSQLAVDRDNYRKCYQEADPTDENFNAAVANDGGFLVIPGMGSVVNMVSVRNALIVLSKDGVWEIQGGRGGFSATDFAVRKLTEEGCTSSTGIVRIEDALLYTGPGGIFIIAPNQYTGQLEVTNVITQTIQTKWNSIDTAQQERCQVFYDDAQKRVYFMVKTEHDSAEGDYVAGAANEYDELLIFDSKIAAWYRYTFRELGLFTGFAIPTADDPDTNKKAKFIYKSTTTAVKVADFAQTSFNDWTTTHAQSLPYMYTSWDNIGDFQRRKQAPIVTVYSKRTETGYVDNGTGWDPTNYSSTLMSGYWDWTNDAVSNKITATQEVYRKVRDFAPASATDVDGYPVVVTRNKLRGRGRVLQLKFEGATDKDSHILGFTINYKVSRRK